MTITKTIQRSKSIDIETPCFYEQYSFGIRSAIGVFSKDDVISIYTSDLRTCISSDTITIAESNVFDAAESWNPITEERFMEIHAEAMKKLSFEPTIKQ